jgi:hypothetical protein
MARTCRGEVRRAWRVEALASCLNVVAAATNALFVLLQRLNNENLDSN